MERKGRGRRSASATASFAAPRRRTGWIAHPMKKLLKGSELVLGVVHQEGEPLGCAGREEGEARAADLRLGEARTGDLVLAEKVGRPPRLAARVDTVLGDPFAPRSFSLIAIHKHGIPHEFPESVIEEAERVAKRRSASARISPISRSSRSTRPTRATMTTRSGRRGRGSGQCGRLEGDRRDRRRQLLRPPGSALDKEARRRGNSVYFPDRVVPMLPESLSADICSLKQGEDRAALACHLQVTRDGKLKSWRFTRAPGPDRGQHRL
jgi:ribonuclease R